MQITNNMCKPVNNQPAFQSRILPTGSLRAAFDHIEMNNIIKSDAGISESRQFINAINAILNDGKKNIVSVADEGSYSKVFVNGEPYASGKKSANWDKSGEGAMNAIIDFAKKTRGVKRVFNYDKLNADEISAVQDTFEQIKTLNPKNKGFMRNVTNLTNLMKSEIDLHVSEKLQQLRDIIFRTET